METTDTATPEAAPTIPAVPADPDWTPRLNAALAAVQAEMPEITKNQQADVQSKSTGVRFSYGYADLAASRAVLHLLGKHGLSFTSMPTMIDGRFVLAYSLRHASGEHRDGTMRLPGEGDFQKIGSAITYMRRYAFTAVTGIAPAEDDDGHAAGSQRFDSDPRSAGAAFDSATPAPPRNRNGNGNGSGNGQRNGNGQRGNGSAPAAHPPVQAAPLPPEDPWSDAIEAIADADEAAARFKEVRGLLTSGEIPQARADHLCALITAKGIALRQQAQERQAQEPSAQADAAAPFDAGNGEWEDPPADGPDPWATGPAAAQEPPGEPQAAPGDDPEWLAAFRRDLAAAGTQEACGVVQRSISAAIKDRHITPATAGTLSAEIRARRNQIGAAA